MTWNSRSKPPEGGEYVVSAQRQRKHGFVVFLYVAYFDIKKGTWHKNDPFEDHAIGEDITQYVTAWTEVQSVFVK